MCPHKDKQKTFWAPSHCPVRVRNGLRFHSSPLLSSPLLSSPLLSSPLLSSPLCDLQFTSSHIAFYQIHHHPTWVFVRRLELLTRWSKATRRWRQQSIDVAFFSWWEENFPVLCCALEMSEYDFADHMMSTELVIPFDVKQSWGVSVVLSEGRKAVPHAHAHCSRYVAVKSLHSLTLGSSRYHVLVFPPNTLLCTFSLPVSPSGQRGVSVSKLVVCYAGDFWGRGQL